MSRPSTFAWVVKVGRRALDPDNSLVIDPAIRTNSREPLYLARAGYRYEYSSLNNADLHATKESARFYGERGDKIVKVRVTIEEVGS